MGSEEPEDHSAVPELAADCDMGSLALSPAEGFLLSRIDGLTSWALLRECGVLPADEVDRCLREWREQGIVSLGDKPAPPAVETPVAETSTKPAPVASTETGSAGPTELGSELEALVDSSLDFPVDQQRALLAFEGRLEGSYAKILGVPEDADTKAIRRAYFKLSKEFHPDRYFRKNLGIFEDRLERVFRKIAEAYELLSDPSARSEMEKSLSTAGAGAPGTAKLSGRTTPHAFSLVARIQKERKRKAVQYFEGGMAALREEKWAEAAQQLRLAIACDPSKAEYKEPFGEANRRANEIRAERYLKEANSRYELGEYAAAYKRFVDGLNFRPFDPEANHRAAVLAFKIEHDVKAAREYGQRACEMEPENASYHKTLAQILTAAEMYLNAQAAYEKVLKLAPGDPEARLELKRVKKLARQGPRGGA